MRPFYKTIVVIVVLLFGVSLSGNLYAVFIPPTTYKPLVEHLKEVNVQWEWASQLADAELLGRPVVFDNDILRIQAHLSMVETLLRTHTPEGLSAAQMQNRSHCLDILHTYMTRGKFPANLYVRHRQPFFIDDFGTPCAVGHLMIETGYQADALQISCEFNTGYVAQLLPLYPQIEVWADKFGFLPKELALIQPGYAPFSGYIWDFLGDGTDAPVYASTQLPDGSMVFGGEFTHANWQTCNNVAVWNGSDFSALGSGLLGQVYALAYFNGNIWAGGFFPAGANMYNLARWNGTNWVYQSIGVGTTFALLVHNSRLYVANEGGVFVRYNSTWSNAGYFNGPVYALGSYNGNLVAGGSFSQANGLSANNIARLGASEVWSPFGLGIQAPVKALALLNNTLYAGGEFLADNNSNNNTNVSGLVRWNNSNNTWQQLINTNNYTTFNGQAARINALLPYNDELYVGGNFQSGLSGNLGRFDSSNGSFTLLTTFLGNAFSPDEVYSLTLNNGKLFISGYLSELWGSSGEIYFTNNIMSTDIATVGLNISCWLQGAFDSSTETMTPILRNHNLLPTQQPYNTAPWLYTGQESVATTNDIPNNAIDWVLVELRDTSSSHTLIASRAGWLFSNGVIGDVSGGDKIKFDNISRLGQYYVVVRHRNHLAVMSKYAVTVPNQYPYSFAYTDNIAGGTSQVAALSGGMYGLCAGDLDANGVITVNDNNILNSQLSIINQYVPSDCDLNRSVTTSDFNIFKSNMSRIGIEIIRY